MKFILNNYMCFDFSDDNLYQHIFLECFADYFMLEKALIICKYILFCTLRAGCQRGGRWETGDWLVGVGLVQVSIWKLDIFIWNNTVLFCQWNEFLVSCNSYATADCNKNPPGLKLNTASGEVYFK